MSKPTKQQLDPHPELVQCRVAIEKALAGDTGKYCRKQAAAICNHLTDAQVDAVLDAKDGAAVLSAIEPAKEVAERNDEPPKEDPSRQKPKSKQHKKQ